MHPTRDDEAMAPTTPGGAVGLGARVLPEGTRIAQSPEELIDGLAPSPDRRYLAWQVLITSWELDLLELGPAH